MSATIERRPIALRIPTNALQHIDAQAQAHGLNRTAYIIQACTGELHPSAPWEEQAEALEQRIQTLEGLAGLHQ